MKLTALYSASFTTFCLLIPEILLVRVPVKMKQFAEHVVFIAIDKVNILETLITVLTAFALFKTLNTHECKAAV